MRNERDNQVEMRRTNNIVQVRHNEFCDNNADVFAILLVVVKVDLRLEKLRQIM